MVGFKTATTASIAAHAVVKLATKLTVHPSNIKFFDDKVHARALCFGRKLLNLNLVAIPMFDSHTAKKISNMLVEFLDTHDGDGSEPSSPDMVCAALDRSGSHRLPPSA